MLRERIAARARRASYLPVDLFGEPAWDMLLDLALAKIEGTDVSITSACIASGAPPTTALRWIGRLVEEGLAERLPHPRDGRVDHLRITDRALAAVAACLGFEPARQAA